MIDTDLATALRAAGLRWEPRQGDAFAVPDRDLDGEVFWLADMVISPLETPDGGALLAFNGTTEWALDSLEEAEALWLPREDQLRELLGDAFASLRRTDGDPEGWVVTLTGGRVPDWHAETTPAAAYARALLAVLADEPGGAGSAGDTGGPGDGVSDPPGGG